MKMLEMLKKTSRCWTPVILVILIVCCLHSYYLSIKQSQDTHQSCSQLSRGAGIPYTSNPILSLSSLTSLSPPSSSHTTCSPPPLPPLPSCAGQPGLTGERLAQARKVVLMIMFGFEVDTLEISLREQLDWVDTVFLVEATTTTKGVAKPLMWERLRTTSRFSFVNTSKVVHVVMDDVINMDQVQKDIWYHENLQTSKGVSRVKNWALQTGHLSPEDLFISADVDEVMSPSALQQLRWCSIEEEIIFGALWMPLGSLDRAYKIEFHVEGRPHTFGMPTIYKWEGVASGKYDGSRLQSKWKGKRDKFVAGGLHMTHTAFLPTAILKRISATERKKTRFNNFFEDFYTDVSLEDLNNQQQLLTSLDYVQDWIFPWTLNPLSSSPDVDPHIPWFLACNQDRYPYWFGQPDPRNADFLAALQCRKGKPIRKKLFYEEGCFDTNSSTRHTKPCLSGWHKENRSLYPSYTGPYDIFSCNMTGVGSVPAAQGVWLVMVWVVLGSYL